MAAPSRQRIFIVDADTVSPNLLRLVLIQNGYEVVDVASAEEALAVFADQSFDLLITDTRLPGMDGFELCRQIRLNPATHTMPILILSSRDEVSDRLKAFEAGANDFVPKPFEPKEVSYRVRNLLARSVPAAPAAAVVAQRAQIIAVFGCKGGVGKTTTAVNLALSIQAKPDKRVLLIDGDFYFGDVGVHLNLPPAFNVIDLVERIQDLDPTLINQILTTYQGGLRVLLSPFKPEKAELIKPEHLKHLLDVFAEMFDYIIVDCHDGYDETTLTILERANDILLILTPEIGPVKNTSIFLDLAERLGFAGSKIHLALNRADSNVGINSNEIERTLQHRVAFRMNSGGRPVPVSANKGVPLIIENPHHPLARQIQSIAAFFLNKSASR